MSNFTWFLALKDLQLGSFKSVHTVHSLILFSVLFLDSFFNHTAFDYGAVAFAF